MNIKAEGFLLRTMSTDGRGCYAASFISTLLQHRNIQQVAFLHSDEVNHHDVILQFPKDLMVGVQLLVSLSHDVMYADIITYTCVLEHPN
jgi:hypothetical protein